MWVLTYGLLSGPQSVTEMVLAIRNLVAAYFPAMRGIARCPVREPPWHAPAPQPRLFVLGPPPPLPLPAIWSDTATPTRYRSSQRAGLGKQAGETDWRNRLGKPTRENRVVCPAESEKESWHDIKCQTRQTGTWFHEEGARDGKLVHPVPTRRLCLLFGCR